MFFLDNNFMVFYGEGNTVPEVVASIRIENVVASASLNQRLDLARAMHAAFMLPPSLCVYISCKINFCLLHI